MHFVDLFKVNMVNMVISRKIYSQEIKLEYIWHELSGYNKEPRTRSKMFDFQTGF